MNHLKRYDPLSIEPVSNMFSGLFRPLRGWMTMEDQDLPDIRLDVSESDQEYVIKADMPGVKKEDIDAHVDGNIVSISAKIENETEQKEDERVICRERYASSIQRSFSLMHNVEESKVQADYKNGTLTLKLPKRASPAQKKITIN